MDKNLSIVNSAEQLERGFAFVRNVWLGAGAVFLVVAAETQETPALYVSAVSLVAVGSWEAGRRIFFKPLHEQQSRD